MNSATMKEVIEMLPDHLAVKVRRVARDENLSIEEAIIFLVKKVLMPCEANIEEANFFEAKRH